MHDVSEKNSVHRDLAARNNIGTWLNLDCLKTSTWRLLMIASIMRKQMWLAMTMTSQMYQFSFSGRITYTMRVVCWKVFSLGRILVSVQVKWFNFLVLEKYTGSPKILYDAINSLLQMKDLASQMYLRF